MAGQRRCCSLCKLLNVPTHTGKVAGCFAMMPYGQWGMCPFVALGRIASWHAGATWCVVVEA